MTDNRGGRGRGEDDVTFKDWGTVHAYQSGVPHNKAVSDTVSGQVSDTGTCVVYLSLGVSELC